MGRTITERQPDGTILYKADKHLDIPSVDLLTMLFDSPYTAAPPTNILHADASNPTAHHLTRAATIALTRQLAHALRTTFGLGATGPDTDVVLVVTGGHYQLPLLFYATIAARGVYSAASPSATPDELAHLVALVAPALIVCDPDTRAAVAETVRRVGFAPARVLQLETGGSSSGSGGDGMIALTRVMLRRSGGHGQGSSGGTRLALSPARTLDWERITDPRRLEASIACVLFSSGTTGLPKGVRMSHRMMVAEAFLTMEPEKAYLRREKPHVAYRTLAHVPAAHVAGVQSYFVNAAYRGGTAYWMGSGGGGRFDFDAFRAHVQALRITYFFSVPPIFLAIAKDPRVTVDQFASVEGAVTGAAPMGRALQAAAEARLGRGRARLTQVWGLSETCGAITCMDPGEGEYTGSVSSLLANHEARIVDEEGRDVAPGAAGEVLVRGPVVTKGYWKNDAANRDSFAGGWFCTGDVGLFRDGMLYIVDRKKELIKYKGLQVAPAELEEVLLANPRIADAAVIGVEGEGTELPRAYVVSATKDLTREEVADYVASKVAPYKKLRGGVVFVDAIPKSPAGKILRKVLREEAKRETLAKL